MKRKYLNRKPQMQGWIYKAGTEQEPRNSLHMMSTMQTLLHRRLFFFPRLLSTLQPQLSFCPLNGGPTLVLSQGLCTGCSCPLTHPSLVLSHSQIFPVIPILLPMSLLRKRSLMTQSKITTVTIRLSCLQNPLCYLKLSYVCICLLIY